MVAQSVRVGARTDVHVYIEYIQLRPGEGPPLKGTRESCSPPPGRVQSNRHRHPEIKAPPTAEQQQTLERKLSPVVENIEAIYFTHNSKNQVIKALEVFDVGEMSKAAKQLRVCPNGGLNQQPLEVEHLPPEAGGGWKGSQYQNKTRFVLNKHKSRRFKLHRKDLHHFGRGSKIEPATGAQPKSGDK